MSTLAHLSPSLLTWAATRRLCIPMAVNGRKYGRAGSRLVTYYIVSGSDNRRSPRVPRQPELGSDNPEMKGRM